MNPLDEMMRRCASLKIDEKRSDSPEYKELVFLNKDMPQWRGLLEELLGPACKPLGKGPSGEDKKQTQAFGGIRNDQILYRKQDGEGTVIVMLWPWGDNQHTTLKMALLK